MSHSLPLFDAPVLSDVKPPKLRPYQERAIVNLRVQILMGHKRILAAGPTGLGKMLLTAAITRMATDPMLFVCHRRELIDQCASQLARFGLTNVGVIRGSDERYNPSASIQIASIQTLARRDKPFLSAKRVLVFVDECFPAGTLVDGRPIESVTVGDEVGSFDTRTGERVRGRVLRVFSKVPTALVRLTLVDRSLICTPNHKLWTRFGWIEAGQAAGQEVMCETEARDALFAGAPQAGSAEGATTRYARVDRVEVLQPGSDGTFGGLCPDGRVYNLEVEDTHTYFANGVAVSNCHRGASDSMREHVFDAYPNAIIIGWTATPTRLDGRPLGGDLFEVLVPIATYDELFKRPDWLARPDVYAAPLRPDVSQVRMSGSDFDDEALDAVVRTSELEGQIVEHWQRLAHLHPVFTKEGVRIPQQFVEGERRRTLGFFVSVAHSQSVAARFEKAGVRVAHLDGTTKEETRRNIWTDLASGALEMVCNCNVAVEGVDVPEIKCIVHARPTWSATSWRQGCGRSMRPWNNVTPIILDHGGTFDRLGCPFEDVHWSLTERPRRLSGRLPMKLCKTCFAYNEPGRVVCLFCGAEFPKAEDRPLPAETSAELLLRQSEPEELKRAFFSRQVTMAKTHGFKPGYASAMYKEQYGHWPPEEWGQKVKADFAHDGAWQASLERRLVRKKAKEERDRVEETEMRKASLTERDKQVLTVYATRGKDERIQPSWWPMPKRVLESFCKLGWLVASGESWEITPAGMAVYNEMCKPLTPEEEAMSQTTRAMNESDESFGDWWEGQQ